MRRYTLLFILFLLLPLVRHSAELIAQSRFTVVLDAGHGGKDSGATRDGVKEKDITLAVALKLGALIKSNHPRVRVLYTRDKDVFVGLQARADFANRHKASLFISIHVNSASPSARGTETYVLGSTKIESNLNVAMRENKAMLLEDDYKTIYRGFNPSSTESFIMFDLMQEAYLSSSVEFASLVEKQYRRLGKHSRGVRQAGFWVLSQSAMPSVLTEIGFVSHSGDRAYLKTSDGQAQIAQALAKAFSQYYQWQGGDRAVSAPQERTDEEISESITATELEVDVPRGTKAAQKAEPVKSKSSRGSVYKVQFMSSPEKLDTKDKRFARLGKAVNRGKDGRNYIYTVGSTKSLEEARKLRKQVSKYYKDCFIVQFQGGKRIGRTS